MSGTGSRTLVVGVLLLCCLSWAPTGEAQEAAVDRAYREFNALCIRHFGAEKEALVYETFGRELKFVASGAWRHVSENSATIAVETNLPAKTYLEYGETARYGKRTPEPERHFAIHVLTLRGLDVERTYHYRVVATDERGNTIRSADATFTTKRIPGAIHVPGDLGRPPYTLDKANATYVLTDDVRSDGTGVFLAGPGITLDLNGHTVTYDEKRDTSRAGACGIRGAKRRQGLNLARARVLNGTIRRGRGNSTTRRMYDDLYGAMFFYGPQELEIAGITIDYDGAQVVALIWINRGRKNDIHHNVFLDRATTLSDRHIGMDSTSLALENSKVHHNLVKRTRHRGLKCGGEDTELCYNEVYIDSWATNSYGLWVGDKAAGHHNRVFGSGFHPIGLMLGYINAKNRTYHSNYIQMQAVARSEIVKRWTGGDRPGAEAGSAGERGITPACGLRLQKGPQEDITFTDNVIVCKASGERALTRGMFLVPTNGVRNVTIRNNTVKLIIEDDQADGWAIAGLGARGEQITLEGNTIISNRTNVRFGDPYSVGGTYRFVANKLVRIGRDPRYRTIRIGERRGPTSGHVFLDTVFEGGAGIDRVSFEGRGERDFTLEWTLTVRTAPGARVTVTDANGKEVFSGNADAGGLVATPLVQYRVTPDGKTAFTPHRVKVEKDGRAAEKTVTVDRKQEIEVKP